MKISDIPARAKVVEDNVDRSNGNKIWITNPNYLPLDSTAGFPEELFGEMSVENSVDIADNYYRIMIDKEGRQAIFEPVDNHYQIESILGVGEKAFGEALHFQVKFSDRIAKFTSKVLNRFSQKNDNGAKVKVTNHFITEPKKKLDTAILSLIYSLNDGQKITIVMFAPDSTPNKIKPTDVFVAYRFLLNQKDITNVVAPQKGKDIPIEKVAKVVMGLAAKNSAKFEKRNNDKTEAENLIKKSTKQIQKQEDYASSLLFFNKLLNNISRIFEEVSKNHPDNEGLPNIKTDFTPEQLLAEYKDNEHYNNHVENDLMLAKAFGSPDEVKKLEEIIEKRERTGGGIEEEDWQWIKDNLIKKNSAIYDKLEKEVARNQAEQLAEKISLKNAGKELDKETERNYLLAESEASFKQANAMIEELKEILAEDNEVNAGQEEIYHHITEKLAGYYSAEDEELKAKAKEIEVLLDDVGEKINTTKNLASQTRIPQEKKHVLSVAEQLGEIDEEILKQQGLLMGESEEELGVDKESESISPAGSLQAEVEDFGEAQGNMSDIEYVKKNYKNIKKIKNPSEEAQRYSVSKEPSIIQHIENQSDKIKWLALENGRYSIRFIKNPTEKMKLFSVEKQGDSIIHIKNPSANVEKKAREMILKQGLKGTYFPEHKKIFDAILSEEDKKHLAKKFGEGESFEENTTEVLSDNNTVFLGTDNGCLGNDNGTSFIGETENAEEDAQDFGEGEEGLTYKGKKLKPVKHTKQPDFNKFMKLVDKLPFNKNPKIDKNLGKKLQKYSYWIMDDDKLVTVGGGGGDFFLLTIKNQTAQDIISKEKRFGEGEVKLKEIENELTAIEGEIGESEISAPVLDLITEIKADLSVEFGEGAKEDRATKKIKKVEETISSVLTKIANLSYELKQMKFFKVSEQVDEVWKKANKGLRESRNIMGNISVWGIDGSTYGETENAEVETIGEGETLHTDNLEAEIKAEIESEIEAQDFGENDEISNFGEMSFKKTKTSKDVGKDGMTFKTDYKDWDKVDELPASFETHSPDLKGVHVEAKRIGATYGGLSRYYRVVLLKNNKTIYTNKGNEFVGLPSAEARGRLFLKKYKKEMAKTIGEGEVTKDFGENAAYREITNFLENTHSSEFNKTIMELVKDYEDKKYTKIQATKMWLKLARTVKNKYRRENSRLYKEYEIANYDTNDLAEDWEGDYHKLIVDGTYSTS